MSLLRVKEDCFCENYLNELNRHYREGLKEKKLKKGEIVNLVKHYGNLYGSYFVVEKEGIHYNIPPEKLELAKKGDKNYKDILRERITDLSLQANAIREIMRKMDLAKINWNNLDITDEQRIENLISAQYKAYKEIENE